MVQNTVILIVLCTFIALTGASIFPEVKWDNNELKQLLRGLESQVESQVKGHVSATGCACVKKTYNCGCCAYLDLPKIHIKDTGCVNISYLPDQYGISVTFTVNGKAWINETISAKNPPPICVGVPHFEKEASVCIDFYDLDIAAKTFSGCIKLEARLYHVISEDVKLGCFKIPLSPKNLDDLNMMKASLEKMKQMQEKKKISFIDINIV